MRTAADAKPEYGVDAPNVMRNFFLGGTACVLAGVFAPKFVHVGPVTLLLKAPLFWTGGFLLAEGLLFLLYVRVGKFRHREFMLRLYLWRGGERVLDVGCGRGLLLVGVAKRLKGLGGGGCAVGIDVWSQVDMGGNSAAATERNIAMEGVGKYCELVSAGAQAMPFADESFDVVVSNLCLHNIYDKATRMKALEEIVRVLRVGGWVLISDYKLTAEYAREFGRLGLTAERRWGSVWTTFPPLRVVVGRKG